MRSKWHLSIEQLFCFPIVLVPSLLPARRALFILFFIMFNLRQSFIFSISLSFERPSETEPALTPKRRKQSAGSFAVLVFVLLAFESFFSSSLSPRSKSNENNNKTNENVLESVFLMLTRGEREGERRNPPSHRLSSHHKKFLHRLFRRGGGGDARANALRSLK